MVVFLNHNSFKKCGIQKHSLILVILDEFYVKKKYFYQNLVINLNGFVKTVHQMLHDELFMKSCWKLFDYFNYVSAMRFAVLEMKVALSSILSQYTIKLSSKTKVPLTYDVNTMMPVPEGGFWFEFEKRIHL